MWHRPGPAAVPAFPSEQPALLLTVPNVSLLPITLEVHFLQLAEVAFSAAKCMHTCTALSQSSLWSYSPGLWVLSFPAAVAGASCL